MPERASLSIQDGNWSLQIPEGTEVMFWHKRKAENKASATTATTHYQVKSPHGLSSSQKATPSHSAAWAPSTWVQGASSGHSSPLPCAHPCSSLSPCHHIGLVRTTTELQRFLNSFVTCIKNPFLIKKLSPISLGFKVMDINQRAAEGTASRQTCQPGRPPSRCKENRNLHHRRADTNLPSASLSQPQRPSIPLHIQDHSH